MSECLNVHVRELLPGVLHDALSASERADVDVHLATCADCAAELELLRSALAATRARAVPRLNTQAIVAALPRPRRASATSMRPSRSLWRMAAAVTIIALGGTSFVVARQFFGVVPVLDTLAAVTPIAPRMDSSPVLPSETPRRVARAVALTADVGVSEFKDDELETLIGALDRIQAAPHAEPDSSVFTRIVSGATGGN